MILPRLAFRGLARNPRSSLTLISLVAAGVLLFSIGDAGLGSAATGIRAEFQDGYTGDIVVKAAFERKFGIFGFSIPAIGEYEEMPTLTEAPAIRKILASIPGIRAQAGLVSGAALLQGPGGSQVKVPVFGVDAAEYFSLFPALRFIEGGVPRDTSAWIVLPVSRVDAMQRAEGKRPAIGENLQFTMASGNAFTIRAVRLAGIVETPIREDWDLAAVYTDPGTLRSLLGLSLGNATTALSSDSQQTIDINSLFSSSEDVSNEADSGGPRGIALLSQSLSQKSAQNPMVPDPAQGAWHFLLARLDRGGNPGSAIRTVNLSLAKAGIKAEAVGWLPVAGLNASILFLLKTVFEIGIGILSGVVVLVITNGLAYSVIEQTKEIGTMRAIGAQKAFVSKLFLIQAVLLVFAGAALGIGLSMLCLSLIGKAGIGINNPYLYMLFGTHRLRPAFQPGTALFIMLGAAVVATVSSIYPINLAMRVSEAQSMAEE